MRLPALVHKYQHAPLLASLPILMGKRSPPREPKGNSRKPNRRRVGEHMAGVRQESQAVGHQPTDEFDQHVPTDQGEGQQQAAPRQWTEIMLVCWTQGDQLYPVSLVTCQQRSGFQ